MTLFFFQFSNTGVPVSVVGEEGAPFPDFFSRDSGLPAPLRVGGPLEAALMVEAARGLGRGTGLLFAVPIPRHAEADGIAIKKVGVVEIVENNLNINFNII